MKPDLPYGDARVLGTEVPAESVGPRGDVSAYRPEESVRPRGDSLAFLLEGGALPEKEALAIFRQVCDAAAVLHTKGYVHRAIDTEHVFIWGSEVTLAGSEIRCKIGDGETKAEGSSAESSGFQGEAPEEDVLNTAESSGFPTGSGMAALAFGTAGYAPAEQLAGGAAAVTEDIYALGVLLNRMLTGCHPSEKLAEGRAGKVVTRCTRMNPRRRYQSVKVLQDALSGKISRRRAAVIVLAAAAAVLLYLFFFYHSPRSYEAVGSLRYELRGREYFLWVNAGEASFVVTGEQAVGSESGKLLMSDVSGRGEILITTVPESGIAGMRLVLYAKETGAGALTPEVGTDGAEQPLSGVDEISEEIREIRVTAESLDGGAVMRVHSLAEELPDGALCSVMINYGADSGTNEIRWELSVKNGDILTLTQVLRMPTAEAKSS